MANDCLIPEVFVEQTYQHEDLRKVTKPVQASTPR